MEEEIENGFLDDYSLFLDRIDDSYIENIEESYQHNHNIYIGVALFYFHKKKKDINLNNFQKDIIKNINFEQIENDRIIFYYIKTSKDISKNLSKDKNIQNINIEELDLTYKEKIYLYELTNRNGEKEIFKKRIDSKNNYEIIKQINELKKENKNNEIPSIHNRINEISNKRIKDILKIKLIIAEANIFLSEKELGFHESINYIINQEKVIDKVNIRLIKIIRKEGNNYKIVKQSDILEDSISNIDIFINDLLSLDKYNKLDIIKILRHTKYLDFFLKYYKNEFFDYEKFSQIERDLNSPYPIQQLFYLKDIEDNKLKEDIKSIKYLVNNSRIISKNRKGIVNKAYYNLFKYGDFISFSRIIVPEIEEIIRTYLKINGVRTWIIEKDNTFNEKGLSSLVNQENEYLFHFQFLEHFRRILTKKNGYNLRNKIAHGLHEEEELINELFELFMIITIIVIYPKSFFKKYHKYYKYDSYMEFPYKGRLIKR